MEVELIAKDEYLKFAYSQRQHVVDHPVCEVCLKEPSVRITRWGPIKAACQGCLSEELAGFNQYCEDEKRAREEWGEEW